MRSNGDHLERRDPSGVELILELCQRERVRIRNLECDGWRRQRILDAAADKLLQRCLSGDPPANLRAWFRRTVDNLIRSNEIPRSRELLLQDMDAVVLETSTEAAIAASHWRELFEPRVRWLLLHLPQLVSDERDRSAFLAMRKLGTRAGARSLDMDHRSFRRAVDRAVKEILLRMEAISEGNPPETAPRPPS